MPYARDVKMPCGRARYCGRTGCRHAAFCAGVGRAAQTPPATGGAQRAAAPGKKPLAHPADIGYLYDGSLAGFYCCVHESVYSHQLPAQIFEESTAPPSLFEQRLIETDPEKAAKVQQSIPRRICQRAEEIVHCVFLSHTPQKELALLRFLLLGYQLGAQAPWMLAHEDVKPVLAAEHHLLGEVHLLKGFIRFSDYGGVLTATITPKNFVLPFLVEHFTMRYSEEDFMIFDKAHKAALIYENRQSRIVPLEGVDFPEADEGEERYRAMWKQFYHTIAIKERTNHKCRRTHMPKRYWENMLEMAELL